MKKQRVAVVGAGIGGITAARTLVDKGHDVVVFEKDARIGGKCMTRTFHGQSYDLGALSVSPEFRTIIKFARRYGAALQERYPFWVLQPDGKQSRMRDEYWKPGETTRLLGEMGRYLFHASKFAMLHSRPRTFVNLPGQYQLPFREFCERYGMATIASWMELPVTSFGYGDLGTIKTWYVLDYISPLNFLGLSVLLIRLGRTPVHQLLRGYGDLVERIAAGRDSKGSGEVKPLDVRLGARVRRIDRSSQGVTIETDAEGSPPDRFDAVVLSAPLWDLSGCLELGPEEKALVEDSRQRVYTVVACELEGVPHDNHLLRFNARESRFGHVALIERNLHGAADKLSVCYIPQLQSMSQEATIAQLRADLEGLGVSLLSVVDFHQWSYFPHFLSGDSYKILEGIQGRNCTYYVGAMTKFELAERVARQAEALIDDMFEGERPEEWFTTVKNWAYFYIKSVSADGG